VNRAQPPVAPPAEDEATRTTVGKIATILEAIEQYQKTRKGLPPTLTSLNRTYANPEQSQDGWGQSILYLVDLTNKTFVIRSAGPDGKRDTNDDISVDSDGFEAWLKDKEPLISAWRQANAEALAQMLAAGSSPADPKKLEAARKLEEEKKKQEASHSRARKQEQEQKRWSQPLEEESEDKRRPKGRRTAAGKGKGNIPTTNARRAESVHGFIGLWTSGMLPQPGRSSRTKMSRRSDSRSGFLKRTTVGQLELNSNKGQKELSLVGTARSKLQQLYLSLGSEKARLQNSLVKYIRLDAQYLNSQREDALPRSNLSIKVQTGIHKVTLTVRGKTITHYIDGIQVDRNDDTFSHGRFGFNASAIEQATIRNVVIEPLR
jgi:hypothetical protein